MNHKTRFYHLESQHSPTILLSIDFKVCKPVVGYNCNIFRNFINTGVRHVDLFPDFSETFMSIRGPWTEAIFLFRLMDKSVGRFPSWADPDVRNLSLFNRIVRNWSGWIKIMDSTLGHRVTDSSEVIFKWNRLNQECCQPSWLDFRFDFKLKFNMMLHSNIKKLSSNLLIHKCLL